MARGRGIVQWIRLALDPAARRKARDEAKEAGREIGDGLADGTSKGAKRADAALDRFGRDAKRRGRRAGDDLADGVERGARRAESALGRLGAFLGAMFALDRIRAFISHMWELGTAAEETQSKFNTTFGKEGSAQVQAFLDDFASLAGLNRTVAQEFAATSGAIVQGMGASKQASGEFSERMLRLAGDLQSFHNVPINETFTAIKSGLVGSWEPLDRFGIVLRQADVNQRALTDTGKKAESQLNNLEKAQAALNLMYERAGPALDDLNRTKDSTANKARNLKAEYENLQIELARALMPVFANLIDKMHSNQEGLRGIAHGAGVVARIVGGVLWAAFNSVASLLAGAVAMSLGSVIGLYRMLENVLMRAIVAKEQFKRIFGAGSEEAVNEARAALHRSNAEVRDAWRLATEGAREMTRAVTDIPGSFNQVWNLGDRAEGEFQWGDETVRPPTQPREKVDPKAGEKAERSRRDALKDEVRLLQEMAERRAQFPELIDMARAAEARITAELEKGTTDLGWRAELLDKQQTLREILAGQDAASLRMEQNRRANLNEEVQLAERLFAVYGDRADVIAQAGITEAALRQELENENIELERQLEVVELLGRLRDARLEATPNTAADETNPLFMEDVQAIMDYWEPVGQFLQDVAQGFADSWQDAFGLILKDGFRAADALKALGKGMAGSILGALSSLARGKVQMNVASAIEELAHAAAAFAWGNAASGAAHLKSAGSHGLAAAAWGVLAGASGAAAGAISGNGGGGGSTSAQSGGRVGGEAVDTARASGPEVHVYLDPINENDPNHQRVIMRAGMNAAERYGAEPDQVFYHSGTRGAA